MKKNSLAIVFLLSQATAFGQVAETANRTAAPKGGVAAVALVYYKIDFTNEEAEYLRAHEAELIFTISEEGRATLEKVNGIEIRSIVDSMMSVNDRLPEFDPEIVDGKPQGTIYFMRLRWPQYKELTPVFQSPYNYFGRKLDEFEYITYRGARFDMLIGGVGNTVGGSAIDYIYSGGGVKFDFMFYGDKDWGGGMVMVLHGNRTRKAYPITTVLPQDNARSTIFFGLAIARLFEDRPAGQMSVQFEPSFALQNIVTVDPQVRNEPVQSIGFSAGVVFNYAKNLGKGRIANYYYMPTAMRHFINFHIGIRPMMLDLSQASGIMYEAGIAWRMAMRQAVDMKLKE
jgi:hypothetical protein